MNLEHDDECTCDIGLFSTCPVCSLRELKVSKYQSKTPLIRYVIPSIAEVALHYQKLANLQRS